MWAYSNKDGKDNQNTCNRDRKDSNDNNGNDDNNHEKFMCCARTAALKKVGTAMHNQE